MKSDTSKRRIAIFKNGLLPVSETFIKAQGEALRNFEVRYIALYPEQPSLELIPSPLLLHPTKNQIGYWRARVYDRFGVAPIFHSRAKALGLSLIHAHFALDGATAVCLSKTLAIPLIVTLHGYDVTVRKPYVKLYGSLWRRTSRFLCISEFIYQRAIDAGFPREKLEVLYTGINLAEFKPNSKKKTTESLSVLFVGRLVHKKGCQVLISAMQHVQKVLPAVTLTIIGDGFLRSDLEKQAKHLGINHSFLGAKDDKYIRERLEEATVFCGPSMEAPDGDSEGLGMVFLEAQALGVPVVSTTHGGIPEAVQQGRTALLASPGDVDSLSDHLLRYLQDPALRQSTRDAGIKFMKERFDIEKQTLRLEQIYEEVLN